MTISCLMSGLKQRIQVISRDSYKQSLLGPARTHIHSLGPRRFTGYSMLQIYILHNQLMSSPHMHNILEHYNLYLPFCEHIKSRTQFLTMTQWFTPLFIRWQHLIYASRYDRSLIRLTGQWNVKVSVWFVDYVCSRNRRNTQ